MGHEGEHAAKRPIGADAGARGAGKSASGFPASKAEVVRGADPGWPAKGPARTAARNHVNPELMDGFFDEAVEILGALNRSIGNWSREAANRVYVREMLENLHTLKGGARLCGLMEIGELAHGFETFLTVIRDPKVPVDEEVFRVLRARRNRLAEKLYSAKVASTTRILPNQQPVLADGVPFSRLLPRMASVVGRLGDELRKQVRLHPPDVEVEINAGVLRRLVMPLEHLLRNAVDHGIETPERRRQRGKPETGRIDLSIGVRDGEIVIAVTDDGGGIDYGKVREQAVGRGALAADAPVDALKVAEMIFTPGVTTAEFVTENSGRGVGLSAARVALGRLGGRLGVSFLPGQGTSFFLRIPRRASVAPALILKLGDDPYAIPTRNIADIVTVVPAAMGKLKVTGAFEQAGVFWELGYLGEFMGLPDQGARTDSSGTLVLMQRAGRRVALYADGLQGRQDIVMRHTGSNDLRDGGIHLVTKLDDGSAIVMLDPLARPGFGGRGPHRAE